MYLDASSLFPKDMLLVVLHKLSQAMQQLATIAIMDAVARNGNANAISLAQQELANGMSDLSACGGDGGSRSAPSSPLSSSCPPSPTSFAAVRGRDRSA